VNVNAQRSEASAANDRGNVAKNENDLARAEGEYLRAIELAPEYESPWFNLGVIYKWQRRWSEARRCVERSLALQPDDNEGAVWNLGIVATALGEWRTARDAWRRYGIAIPDGDGPIEENFGLTPIRMRVDQHEVVWCRRIDPARAIVRSIPLPESGRRYGDLLLHDGAPTGYRKLGEKEVPVFDELELLAPSALSTFEVSVVAPNPKATGELIDAFEAAGMSAEDWTASVRILCKACSEGRPHTHGHDDDDARWTNERRFGIAALDAPGVERVLATWVGSERRRWRRSRSRDFTAPERVVEGAPRA
jgi:tetratricopeptide (TPR) repeat protein